MIKLMHFIHGLNTGGAETLVKDYMLNIDRSRFDIVLLCLRRYKNSPYEELLKRKKVRVLYVQDYLPFKEHRTFLEKIINYPIMYYVVRDIIRKENPDIIHSHLPLNTFVKFSRPDKKTILFHTVHNEPNILWSGKLARRMDYGATKWLVRHYNMRFIVLHDAMRTTVDKMFNVHDSVVLNNGIIIDEFSNLTDPEVIKREVGIPKDTFVIGHIGRFSKQKNHAFLVKIFKEIKSRRKNAFLLMVGDGSNKNEIVSYLNNNDLKNSYCLLSNRDDIPRLLSVMDVFVFPSLFEGLPLSLIEAQVSGRPCFVSEAVNDYTVISNLVTKLPISNNEKEWADTILAYNKPKIVKINTEDWDIKKITKKLEQIYLDALAERRNGKK